MVVGHEPGDCFEALWEVCLGFSSLPGQDPRKRGRVGNWRKLGDGSFEESREFLKGVCRDRPSLGERGLGRPKINDLDQITGFRGNRDPLPARVIRFAGEQTDGADIGEENTPVRDR